jgi:hypothetical protein
MDSMPSFCQVKRDLLKPVCTLVGGAARSTLAGGSGEGSGALAYSAVCSVPPSWVYTGKLFSEGNKVLLRPCNEAAFDPLR